MRIKSNKVITNHSIIPAVIEINGNRIQSIDQNLDSFDIDYGENYILPGLIDTHTHGIGGWSFSGSLELEEIKDVLQRYRAEGTTSILATCSHEALSTVAEFIDHHEGILGIHREGPFLSNEQIGSAAPGTTFPDPDFDFAKKTIQLGKGHIKVAMIAPEKKNALEVMKYYKSQGVLVSVGHTQATYQQLQECSDYFDSFTHTGNAMRGIHHREVGTLGSALLMDKYAEIIADGLHLSEPMMKLMLKNISRDKMILISDSTGLAGLPAGRYELPNRVLIKDESGKLLSERGALSGSAYSAITGFRNLVSNLNVPIEVVSQMASLNPARLLGLEKDYGSIDENKYADLIVLDPQLELLETHYHGNRVYKKGDPIINNPHLDKMLVHPEFLNAYK